MKLTIRKLECAPARYEIVWTPSNKVQFLDASVEGSADEMLAVAEAIDDRKQARFAQCAVYADIEPVRFVNNGTGRLDEASREEALDLSRQIHELLGYAHAPKCATPASSAPSGDFSIGSRVWPGTSKLIEEMGELQQVLGKLIAIGGATDHWSGDLRKMLVEELGDAMAAIRFFVAQNLTAEEGTFVAIRSDNKLIRFTEWQLDPKPPPAVKPAAPKPVVLDSERGSTHALPAWIPEHHEAVNEQSLQDDGNVRAEAFAKGNAPPQSVWILQHRFTGAMAMVYNRYQAKLGQDQIQHEYRLVTHEEPAAPKPAPAHAAEPGYTCKCGQFVAWANAGQHGCYATPGPPVWPYREGREGVHFSFRTVSSVTTPTDPEPNGAPRETVLWWQGEGRYGDGSVAKANLSTGQQTNHDPFGVPVRYVRGDLLDALRAKVQAFERAEEIGFNAQGLHDRIDALHDAIAKRPVVKPVEGSEVGELDFVYDDHSHLYVPSSEYEHVLNELQFSEQELRLFAKHHMNDSDELGVRARAALDVLDGVLDRPGKAQ